MRRYADSEALAALVRNVEETRRIEREYAVDAFRNQETVTYCRGAGHPVVRLHSLAEWEARDGIGSRRRAN